MSDIVGAHVVLLLDRENRCQDIIFGKKDFFLPLIF